MRFKKFIEHQLAENATIAQAIANDVVTKLNNHITQSRHVTQLTIYFPEQKYVAAINAHRQAINNLLKQGDRFKDLKSWERAVAEQSSIHLDLLDVHSSPYNEITVTCSIGPKNRMLVNATPINDTLNIQIETPLSFEQNLMLNLITNKILSINK